MKNYDIFEYVNNNPSMWFERDKAGTGFICPICGSGSGKNGTGIQENPKYPLHYTCFAGDCFRNATAIDILAIKNGIDPKDPKAVIENAERCLNLPETPVIRIEPQKKPKETPPPESTEKTEAFKAESHRHLYETNYWLMRGLSEETAIHFKLGFARGWKHPSAPATVNGDNRLIIPTGEGSYVARKCSQDGGKYSKMKVGQARFMNIDEAVKAERPIFIVEGEFDMMSIHETGHTAIAAGSIVMLDTLIEELIKREVRQPIILALDNDERGLNAIEKELKKLSERKDELIEKGFHIIKADPKILFGNHKDANESLCTDGKKTLSERLSAEEKEAVKKASEEKNEKEKELLKNSAKTRLTNLLKKTSGKGLEPISTGFKNLDKALDGGLYPGLHIIGAISSLGKTTLCLQIADQIAESGNEVIIFSLEMSGEELVAKSLSRLTATIDIEESRSVTKAMTTRDILRGKQSEILQKACERYEGFSERIFIYEGGECMTTSDIRKTCEKHMRRGVRKPVVIIDYLQIIDPPEDGKWTTDKQACDKNIKSLKILSRDLNCPVIAISSFNRDNYTSPVNMGSFKESGAIEYSSDVLIGMQHKGMDEAAGEGKGKALEIIRSSAESIRNGKGCEIEVKIIKQRNGAKGKIVFDYFPGINKFREKENTDEWRRVGR